MKKYMFAAIILIIVVAASGCIGQTGTGSGNLKNESKNVSGFNQIDLNGMGTLIITQGDKESLTVEAEDNVMPYIKTDVSNNKLSIKFENNSPVPTKPVKFYLTVKDINSIAISGSGKIESNKLNAKDLTIVISGAGEGNLTNLNATTLTITISGAGKMYIAGNVTNQTITISGAGEYTANDLSSKTVTITINGAGKATLRVSDLLNAIINGGGDISYIGNPKITQQINGAGNIKQIPG
ncbi:MAG: DUF2807 domain-containing protein [Euryarchaeota archaeon]|nr:DUF2807 domain-containing protein [Euryarchaeota archaeon]